MNAKVVVFIKRVDEKERNNRKEGSAEDEDGRVNVKIKAEVTTEEVLIRKVGDVIVCKDFQEDVFEENFEPENDETISNNDQTKGSNISLKVENMQVT